MGKFEIYKDTRGEYRFRLKARNGEIILSSEGYNSKEACKNGIDSVQENAKEISQFSIHENSQKKWSFHLSAKNHQIIGVSQLYATKQSAENGIESVMHTAPLAPIIELFVKL